MTIAILTKHSNSLATGSGDLETEVNPPRESLRERKQHL